jgi:ABC-type Mn2+/Zn2+ transport system permease subunit
LVILATGNAVTNTLLIIALIASVVGMTASFVGTHYLWLWRTKTLDTIAAILLIAWLLTLLVMGIACKDIHTSSYHNKRLVSI